VPFLRRQAPEQLMKVPGLTALRDGTPETPSGTTSVKSPSEVTESAMSGVSMPAPRAGAGLNHARTKGAESAMSGESMPAPRAGAGLNHARTKALGIHLPGQ
jgi:hypothetical protein